MTTFERIRDIVSEVSGVASDAISLESTVDEIHLNRLDMVEIVMAVEDEFDIWIEDENSINSIRDIIDRVETWVA